MESLGFTPATIAVFISMVTAMLALDFYNHRKNAVVTLSSAIGWSMFYVACAFVFAGYLFFAHGSEASSLFLTGYALEKVLSFDNLFVISLILAYFQIPEKLQHKALYWGIAGAIVFRLLFVIVGVSFMDAFGVYMEIAFAFVILYTVYLMYAADGDDDVDYSKTWYVRGIRKIYPAASILFVAIATIEICDILFSFDSVPAILSVTKHPVLVYAAMLFAILGLRSMFFVMTSLQKYFTYMDEAVMLILLLIAAKLLLGAVGIHIDPLIGLFVIVNILVGGVIVSVIKGEKDA